MIKDRVLSRIFKEAAEKHNLTEKQIENIYNSWGLFIRRKIIELDFNGIQTDKEFKELKTNFNIPHIGKLYTNFKQLNYKRNQSEIRRKINESKEESRGDNPGDVI